ncbi:hypothetical protein [Yinghuangia soli]|uniref:Uncharacterized protein n=1 Tax=Yinghuangia soli TaxID=2908204 RepID=A0AA41U3M5_9ACTN|nr:hypothetical protein [Yinghuangia soli]MCF2528209.1 hypothetical protein [Yinghuangia soli]
MADRDHTTAAWVWSANVRPFLEMVSELIEYRDVRLARAVGGDEVSVAAAGPADERLHSSLALLFSVFSRYEVAPSA